MWLHSPPVGLVLRMYVAGRGRRVGNERHARQAESQLTLPCTRGKVKEGIQLRWEVNYYELGHEKYVPLT